MVSRDGRRPDVVSCCVNSPDGWLSWHLGGQGCNLKEEEKKKTTQWNDKDSWSCKCALSMAIPHASTSFQIIIHESSQHSTLHNLTLWTHVFALTCCRSISLLFLETSFCLHHILVLAALLYHCQMNVISWIRFVKDNTYKNNNNIIIQFNSIQFNSLLFMCWVNSYKANYRHSTV
jgi:hypothetical protein